MKKHNLLKSVILTITVLTGTIEAFGYAEVEQTINLSVQPTVAIAKTSANENGSIEPTTGAHSGLSASFSIKTNGTDDNYDFIVKSEIVTLDGTVSAFGQNGCLLFANTTSLPSTTAVENAKVAGGNNRNVIAYPVTMDITTPMTVDYSKASTYGDCYVIKVNSLKEGTLTQTIGQTPVSGTYLLGEDESGSYKSTVYFTTVSK